MFKIVIIATIFLLSACDAAGVNSTNDGCISGAYHHKHDNTFYHHKHDGKAYNHNHTYCERI